VASVVTSIFHHFCHGKIAIKWRMAMKPPIHVRDKSIDFLCNTTIGTSHNSHSIIYSCFHGYLTDSTILLIVKWDRVTGRKLEGKWEWLSGKSWVEKGKSSEKNRGKT
jgi:hypothetical protein